MRDFYIFNGRLFSVLLCATAVTIIPSLSDSASAQTQMVKASSQDGQSVKAPNFHLFKPNPRNRSKLEYSIWNDALEKVVIDFGPSTRLRARKPAAGIGTRFVKGHKSAYRLEGSRFTFEFLTDDYRKGLTDYRKDLEAIATDYDITRFPRKEQLAFWINLHNVAVLEKIAINYPMQRPEETKIKVNGKKYKLDKAPFIEVLGQTITLKDIREKIVYKHWDNPNVIYGFFTGDIGSPSLQSYAYTSDNLEVQLNQNADDFVNSLRGFNLGSATRNVSRIYETSAPYYFKDWDKDLTAHLLVHANEGVRNEIQTPFPIKIDKYDNMIADLSGGQRLGSSGSPTNTQGLSFETRRMLNEVRDKREYLLKRDMIQRKKGYVIIEDLVPEEDRAKLSP